MRFPEYDDHDATGLAELVRTGQASAGELVEAAIARVEARDPGLNAVVHRQFERARAEAAAGRTGPFAGVPFLLKDLMAEDAGQPSTGSCRLGSDWRAPHDSELVARYKRAGLIIVGRCNTSEFGILGSAESDLRGPAHNPWDLARSTGGSSGGSGAAVAARMVPAAHGGDGGGSIRIPASHCGLVGLKPTRGRNPLGPVGGEHWASLVEEHVLTRSVRDCAALLDATAGPDPGAPYQVRDPERPYAAEVGQPPGVLRIAFTTDALFAERNDPDCVAAVEDAAALARSLGHQVEAAAPTFDRPALIRAYLFVVAAGVSSDLAVVAARAGRAPRAGDVEPATWLLYLIARALSAAEYVGAVDLIRRASRQVAEFFTRHDVLLTATCARPPVPLGEFALTRGQRMQLGALRAAPLHGLLMKAVDEMAHGPLSATPNTQLFNMTGQPAISLPLSWSGAGLPIGTQWVGPYGREDLLLRLAAQLEAARPWATRRPPMLAGGA
ncbi:MAG: amidase [Kofleriaceae bacterium]|nr:amidase [Kofleriaceae bacterium]